MLFQWFSMISTFQLLLSLSSLFSEFATDNSRVFSGARIAIVLSSQQNITQAKFNYLLWFNYLAVLYHVLRTLRTSEFSENSAVYWL